MRISDMANVAKQFKTRCQNAERAMQKTKVYFEKSVSFTFLSLVVFIVGSYHFTVTLLLDKGKEEIFDVMSYYLIIITFFSCFIFPKQIAIEMNNG
jgi:uncharacterized membrane protein